MKPINKIISDINGSKKTLYILCGLPYSGKTYLSEKILAETSAAYVSIDKVLKDLDFDWDSNKLPNENEWEEVFDISYQKTREFLKNNLNVLYDSTNHTKISRNILRNIAKDAGAGVKVIYVDIPVELMWKRWEENNIKKNRSNIDKKLVKMTVESFDIPTEDENVLIVKN